MSGGANGGVLDGSSETVAEPTAEATAPPAPVQRTRRGASRPAGSPSGPVGDQAPVADQFAAAATTDTAPAESDQRTDGERTDGDRPQRNRERGGRNRNDRDGATRQPRPAETGWRITRQPPSRRAGRLTRDLSFSFIPMYDRKTWIVVIAPSDV